MRDIVQLKKEFLDGPEFSIIVLTSVVNPQIDFSKIPQDERLHQKDLTKMFIEDTIPGIFNNSIGENFELIIVDNGSCQDHQDVISKITILKPDTRIVFNNKNFGVAPGWNTGLKLARGKYICIISDDYILKTRNFLRTLQKPMLDDPNIVITGPEGMQLNPAGMGSPLWRLPYIDATSVNCVMFQKKFLKEVDYLDEYYYPYLCEDSDIGLIARRIGYEVMQVELKNSYHWGCSSVYRYWTSEEIDEIFRLNRQHLIEKFGEYLNNRTNIDERYK